MKVWDWSEWEMPGFRVNTRHSVERGWKTCGSSTLSLITGLNPVKIEAQLPNKQKHWSTFAAAKFLNKSGFQTKILSGKETSESLSEFQWDNPTVTSRHVLMLNCLTNREEASWFLHENGNIWHNFNQEGAGVLFLLRRPLQYAILIK